ncbi:MAG: hypothetical protein FXF47_05725 [Candidatus Mcinerneyibacterium aminivorans]|uniref:Permease n=1 Tax=Candidatus Mcinerneyibacterium aminivorans TaxID=2703815 RepID=A0A5D0MDQ3_9BACT|nr:MAG: hypothetical protein FXF47_05725 [Candidatus Mcinerneyibacterium aminivorans]
MKYLYIVAAIALIISFVKDKKKTLKGIKRGLKKFQKILPKYLMLLVIISIVLLLSEDFIIKYLNQGNILIGTLSSVIIGSVTMMPGFIAYPLSGVLLEKGVAYIIIGGFVTSLMLVGVVTYPVEKEYFGKKLTILRNLFGFLIAVGIAIGIGLFYGEVL